MGGLLFPGIDAGIAHFEGFGQPNVPATVNNNPGNIICSAFATNHGATGCNGSYATFPDVTTGLSATDALVSNYAGQGDTLDQLINSWVPPTAPGNSVAGTQSYSDYLSNLLGVSSSTPLSNLQGVQPPTSLTTTSTGAPSAIGSILSTIGGSILSQLPGGAVLGASTILGISVSRVAAFFAGLILIAGGIYLFRPVQQIVQAGVSHGKRAAELLAE